MSVFTDLYEAHLTIGGHDITWREILGNAFGLASAVGGMRRQVWAWPVGIIGNVLLFTVFLFTATEGDHGGSPLLGQAGRQVFFIVVSVYGWWRWSQNQRSGDGAPAVVAALGDGAGAGGLPRASARRCRGLLRRLPRDRCRLPGGVVVLPGRRVDLRRLDRRDLRDGPRLGGLLAVLDRRRPGRRAAAAALELLPVGRALRHLRRLRDLGLRHLAAGGAHRGRAGRRAAPRPDEVPA